MKSEYQGCLIGIGMMVIYGAVLFVAYKLYMPFLKCACYLLPGLTGAYIGSRYFSTAKQKDKNSFSRRTWVLLIIGSLVLAALLSWWLEGKLW